MNRPLRIARPILCLVPAFLIACEGNIAELGVAERMPGPTVQALDVPKVSSFRCDKASGPAPLPLRCNWTLSAIKGAVSCKLDPGDGSTPYTLANCADAGEQVHQFNEAGQFKMKFTVANASTASFNVNVTDPAVVNSPPEIATFSGAPLKGVPPFESTLTWSVSDPNPELITCLVDVGDDGSVEQSINNCTSSSTYKVNMTSLGTKNVRLTVKDGRGLTATQTLTLEGQSAIGDLSIAKVEWGQSVISDNPTLVGGKPALIRVHVIGSKSGISGVTAKAEILSNGASVASVTLMGPPSPPTAVDTALSLNQQFVGTLPGDKMASGVEVKVTVDPDGMLAEDNENNNTMTLTPSVSPIRDVFQTSVPVVQQGMTGTVQNWEQIMQQLWPIRNVVNQTRAPYTYSGALSGGNGGAWSSLLSQLAAVRNSDGSQRQYYGYVKVNYGAGIAGIGYIGQLVSTGRDNSDDTYAHEVGHNMGRPHAPCGGAAGPDPGYPSTQAYSQGRIGSVGYNFVNQSLVDPSTYRDLMGYCNPEWVSDYNYKKVQGFLTQNPPVANNMAPRIEMNLAYGIIGDDNHVELGPIHRVLTDLTPKTGDTGLFTLRVFADGVQREFPLHTAVTGEDAYHHHFNILFPNMGEMTALEILRKGKVIYRKVALPVSQEHSAVLSESREKNQVVVKWDAKLHPYALVAHITETERTTLALELKDGEGTVYTQGLPEGGRFEVVLSDGLNSLRKEFPRLDTVPLELKPNHHHPSP